MTKSRFFSASTLAALLIGALLGIAIIQLFYSAQLREQLATQANPTAYTGTQQAPSSYADAVARAFSSVVKIYTARVVPQPTHPLLNDPFFSRFFNQGRASSRDKVARGLGSGVIVDTRGYVLTNFHLIENVDSISVMLADGNVARAQVVGTDEATDLAVLKIDAPNLVAAQFAHPGSERIGDVVLAIGNPYGIGQTVTQGIISATGRYGLNLNTYENYIQTDAAINQGNSGGALINTTGEVIGINSSLYSRSGASTGIGFAIPGETALYVLNSIIEQGKVVRGWLGVSVEDITPSLAKALNLGDLQGLLVTATVEGGPAAMAGIRAGDILTHFDKREIESANSSMHSIAQTRPGTKISVRLLRNGAAQSTLVSIGQRPAADSSD